MSPRPSLPCLSRQEESLGAAMPAASMGNVPHFPKFLTKFEYSSRPGLQRQPCAPSAVKFAPRRVLAAVVPLKEQGEEDDADDWELEFLRRAQFG